MATSYKKAILIAAKIMDNLNSLEKDSDCQATQHRKILARTGSLCFSCYDLIDEIIAMENKDDKDKKNIDLSNVNARNVLNAEYYINREEMTVHIEFDGRLPSRKELTAGAESYKRSSFKRNLLETICYIFRDYPNFRYSSKADLLIYQEYATSMVARDHDNTDIKDVIDCITLGHLIDDSPDYLRLRLDGGVTGRNHVSLHLTQISY